MRNLNWLLLLGLLSGILAGCATGTPEATSLAAGRGAAASTETIPYKIGPGDKLSVFVYGAPDLSVKSVPVRPDGQISIPLVQNIMAAGLTPRQLSAEITKRLTKYVQSPNVTVIVDSFHGALGTSVFMLSGGAKPKVIPYIDHMTLLDVMTQVGGVPEFGAPNSAYVLRRADGKETRIPVRIGALLNRGVLSQNIPMMPGDIVVIPQSLF